MKYEWDKNKEQINISKHKLSFDVAEDVFAGDTFTFPDERRDYNEPRFITVGRLKGRMVIIAHTYRGEKIRIISMRRANERERKIYQGKLKTS